MSDAIEDAKQRLTLARTELTVADEAVVTHKAEDIEPALGHDEGVVDTMQAEALVVVAEEQVKSLEAELERLEELSSEQPE